jgi:hypothetical protein
MEKSGDLRNVVTDRVTVQPPVTHPTHYSRTPKLAKTRGEFLTTNSDFVLELVTRSIEAFSTQVKGQFSRHYFFSR